MFFLRLFLLISFSLLFAEEVYDPNAPMKPLRYELVPLSKTIFRIKDLKKGTNRTVSLKGKDFILVSVREIGSDGRFYAVDRDGTVWLSGAVTSGAPQFRSPSGIFHIIQKKRYHMSNRYPDESGVNNMDFMMKFTKWGHALHKGSTSWMSHGCIHIDPHDIGILYRWAYKSMPVVITRHTYMPFAKEDLKRIYLD
jgi:lipoprotein-anchoring transpeptidase ErfK/SrfK